MLAARARLRPINAVASWVIADAPGLGASRSVFIGEALCVLSFIVLSPQ